MNVTASRLGVYLSSWCPSRTAIRSFLLGLIPGRIYLTEMSLILRGAARRALTINMPSILPWKSTSCEVILHVCTSTSQLIPNFTRFDLLLIRFFNTFQKIPAFLLEQSAALVDRVE
jgi:hypothetical protein